jgi:hypothetical protein
MKTIKQTARFGPRARTFAVCLAAIALLSVAGCKSKPAPVDDNQLASTVQSQLSSDSALAGQSIQPTAQQGVVTLNGTVANDAQRTIAARDAAGVAGVQRVVNAIQIGSPLLPNPSTTTTTTPVTVPVAPAPSLAQNVTAPHLTPRQRREQEAAERAQQHAQQQAQQQQIAQNQPPAPIERPQPPQQQAYVPPPPPPPPAPVFKNVNLVTGTTLPVRVTQTLDSASTQAGSTFSGTITSDIMVDGVVAIPAGSVVSGIVNDVKDAAHFKGSSMLSVSLSTVTRRGEHLAVTTDPYVVQGKGRGTNTAEKIGGGAAVGAILGGILGGGRGAAIGAAAGGGTGAGVNAVTRGQQVQIQSETVVRFHLASPLSVRVRLDGQGDRRDNADPSLEHHNP